MKFYRQGKKYYFLGLLLLTGGLIWTQQGAMSQPPLPLPEATEEIIIDRTKYAPATFGIPDTLGGYEVLAVFTSANTVCLPEGIMELLVQTHEHDMDQFLGGNTPQTINEAVKAMNLPGLYVQVIGPVADINRILMDREASNQFTSEHGCQRLGPVPEGVMSPG